jgi:hypothetical protein
MAYLRGYMISAFDNNSVLSQHKHAYADQKLYAGIAEYCKQTSDQPLVTAVRELEAHLIKTWQPPKP